MQPVDELSEAAKLAYQSFLDMSNSRTAHIACLKAHEAIYESGGIPSSEDKMEIEKLLSNHDKNVLAFNTAMAAVTDNTEKEALIQLLS